MKISEIITDKYKLHIPPTVYYDLLADVVEAEEEQEPKWIPVSERLPKENGYYLTTTMYHEVYCDYWEEERFNRTETVIAWMPLPKPYKAESENST